MLKQLIDFFEGRGRFKIREEYTGMLASQIPEIFIEYFDELSFSKKNEMMKVIVQGMLGEIEELNCYLEEMSMLLSILCLEGYSDFFKEWQKVLEKEITDPNNLKIWIKAQDIVSNSEGVNFKNSWRYPLIIWKILYYIKSDKADDIYNYFQIEAKSETFKESLQRTKEIYKIINE